MAYDLPDLVTRLTEYSAAYRRGEALVSDAEYDALLAELRKADPSHPFLTQVEDEPEDAFGGGERVRLPIPMLSTEKCYDAGEVMQFVRRVREAAERLGVAEPVRIGVQPKLDGNAGCDLNGRLLTRGRNGYGTDVTRAFDRGLQAVGGRGQGAGEIVVEEAFFEDVLKAQFDLDHPRNAVAGLLAADTLVDYHEAIIKSGAFHFIPFAQLPVVDVSLDAFATDWEALMLQAQAGCPYRCDGAVASVIDPALREAMGATSHHHRWQVALKRNDEAVETEVQAVRLTTGRTGRITPTIMVRPVYLGGATITYASAHHAAYLRQHQLGPGSGVLLHRGGDVIPTIARVLSKGTAVALDACPSGGAATAWEGEKYLVCTAMPSDCPAMRSRAIGHVFKTLGVCNGFGPVVCNKLADAGKTIVDIYRMTQAGFVEAGISAGVAANLIEELRRSLSEPIEDAILLGALGIRHLGRGDSRKILAVHPIERLDQLTVQALQSIPGFGEGTSAAIIDGLQHRWPDLRALLDLGFNLQRQPAAAGASSAAGPLAGMTVVFTGAMTSGSRSDMENQARQLGATVGSSVSAKTTLLVCGEKVGAGKTEKAAKLGVQVINEAEYMAMFVEVQQ